MYCVIGKKNLVLVSVFFSFIWFKLNTSLNVSGIPAFFDYFH